MKPEYERADWVQRKRRSIPADDTFSYFGVNDLDKYLYHTYLKNIKNGFYIDCGAANGINQSNTAALGFYYGWTGLLVEANPFQYQNILKHRRNCKVANCALVSHEYKEEYIEGFFGANPLCLQGAALPHDASPAKVREAKDDCARRFEEDPNAAKELEDCMCAQIKTNHNYDEERHTDPTKTLEVAAKTLDWVLSSEGIEKADFFSLDVEGYELEVLKGWSPRKYPIKYILIEGRLVPEEKSPIDEYMEQNNYKLEEHVGINNMLYSLNN